MTTTRRSFLCSASAAGIVAAIPGPAFALHDAPKALNILVLGGTGFIGPHEINYARARGHKVTMFNRGKTAPDMFPDVEALIGDRDNQLDALKGRDWDAVIDNSGYLPRHVQLSAELLHGHVEQYMFVSSISAYGESLSVDDDEFSSPIATMADPTDESNANFNEKYGPRKALCEQEVARVFGDQGIIVRPGLISGTGDPTDRLRHWLRRLKTGNEVLVPGDPEVPVQFIDAADMCGWMVRLLESGSGSGPYNACGGLEPYTARSLLEDFRDAAGSDSKLTWIDWTWLQDQGMQGVDYSPWFAAGAIPFMQVNNDRAVATGLTFRPVTDTARDMLAELDQVPEREGRRSGLDAESEAEMLAKWHA